MSVNNLSDDGVRNLMEAIIVQAAKDYMKTLKKKWKMMSVGKYGDDYNKVCSEVATLEQFFVDMGAKGIRDACYYSARDEFNARARRKTALA